ncbi:MAG: TonB-dependent receptor [Bacteroidota bacterium]|nr:TonB-dependent receptor [Bacteroidota bacterium]
MKHLLCLLSLFIVLKSFAQSGSVSGQIIDSAARQPLDYASISLLNSVNNKLISGVVTDVNGKFKIEKIKAGSYRLKIQFIGYETKQTEPFSINSGQAFDIGIIDIIPGATLLKEVTVSGNKINSLNKIDKQSYRADQFEAAKGGSAIDVLKNLPSVSVNGQGEISVRGSTGFLVLINGKPVLTDAATILSQLPANSLQNIELITAPSAKYDPDGKAGIINIITKKGTGNGITFVANAQGGLPSTTTYNNLKKPTRFGGDATFNYRKDKWDISVGGDYTRNDIEGYREGDVYVKNPTENTITRLPSDGERSFNRYNYSGRTSIAFTPDSNNSFSLGFFEGRKFQDRLAALNYRNSTSDLTTGNLIRNSPYYNKNLETKEGNFTLGNLDYTFTFKDKATLSASILYEKDNLYGNDKNLNLVNSDPWADTIQYVYNPYTKPLEGWRFKLDHAINLGKGKLESGYQFRYDTQEGNYGYTITPLPPNPDYTRFRGSAKSKNTINAIYTQYSGKASKLDYVAGLRYEYASRTLNLVYGTVPQPPHYLNLSNLFPSANILYSFNHNWDLKAGYSRRIQRTTNNELNPIAEREHSESLEQGDPDVLPEYVDLAELGLTCHFSGGSVFGTLYYQGVQNPIQRVNSIYNDSILNRLFTNAGHARSLGLELSTNLQFNNWWSFYFGGNVYNYKIKGNLTILGITTPIDNQSWVYSFNANTNFQLSKSFSLQGNVKYLSKRPTAQGQDSRFLSPNISLKKSFMHGLFITALQWQNIDLGLGESNRQRITTSGADFYTTTNYIYETDVLMLNFSFNLNKFTSKNKLPKTEFGEKEF